jgi:hypothetical protein
MKKIVGAILTVWTSQKLWMTLTGITILYAIYWRSVNYLYSFALPEQITALVSLYQTCMYGVVAAILGFLGITGVVSLSRTSTDLVQQVASHVFERKESKSEEIKTTRTEGGAKAFCEGTDE